MKTHQRVRRRLQLRLWAGVVALLLLASAEFWMLISVARGHAPAPHGEANPMSELSDLIAAQ